MPLLATLNVHKQRRTRPGTAITVAGCASSRWDQTAGGASKVIFLSTANDGRKKFYFMQMNIYENKFPEIKIYRNDDLMK